MKLVLLRQTVVNKSSPSYAYTVGVLLMLMRRMMSINDGDDDYGG